MVHVGFNYGVTNISILCNSGVTRQRIQPMLGSQVTNTTVTPP
jgi:hypothetical protein